jgi:hypothetical protein
MRDRNKDAFAGVALSSVSKTGRLTKWHGAAVQRILARTAA